jgi:EAL domain-containing protein (putative c-di-GMP-specific phosphodiesterase class I)
VSGDKAGVEAERVLADVAERWLRAPQDKLVLVLHLSRLTAPAPRLHHLRVARVLMQDCAQRAGGQVLMLQNQDLVLLCASPREQGHGHEAPAQLRATLARLFVADVPDAARLISLWRLEEDAGPFRAYLAACGGAAKASPADSMPANTMSLAALEEIIAHAPLAELMVQQTGMALDPDRKLPLASRLTPSFRQLGVSLAGLNLRPVVSDALTDPYLRQHFTATLDARLLRLLHDDLQAGGQLTRAALRDRLPVHVPLSLDTIATAGFARLSILARGTGLRLAVDVSPLQACVEPEALAQARSLLAPAAIGLILGPLDTAMLTLLRPAALRPDMVKLVWSQSLADAVHDPHGGVAITLARIGFRNIVLQGVETEHGVAWGQARGIGRFQGTFFDHAQGAARMAACAGAAACTLRQCVARASFQGVAGRAGCTVPALLDRVAMPGAREAGAGEAGAGRNAD